MDDVIASKTDTSDSQAASQVEAPVAQESDETILKEDHVQLTSQVTTEATMTETTPATSEISSSTTAETQ